VYILNDTGDEIDVKSEVHFITYREDTERGVEV
jgi:hypothetical protein